MWDWVVRLGYELLLQDMRHGDLIFPFRNPLWWNYLIPSKTILLLSFRHYTDWICERNSEAAAEAITTLYNKFVVGLSRGNTSPSDKIFLLSSSIMLLSNLLSLFVALLHNKGSHVSWRINLKSPEGFTGQRWARRPLSQVEEWKIVRWAHGPGQIPNNKSKA